MPIVGEWFFDYGGGVALLFGHRKFDVSVTTGFTAYDNPLVMTFNADGWLAVSYPLSSTFRVSAGVHGDFYDGALTTYDINTGALKNIDRFYWGPFVRLTGTF